MTRYLVMLLVHGGSCIRMGDITQVAAARPDQIRATDANAEGCLMVEFSLPIPLIPFESESLLRSPDAPMTQEVVFCAENACTMQVHESAVASRWIHGRVLAVSTVVIGQVGG